MCVHQPGSIQVGLSLTQCLPHSIILKQNTLVSRSRCVPVQRPAAGPWSAGRVRWLARGCGLPASPCGLRNASLVACIHPSRLHSSILRADACHGLMPGQRHRRGIGGVVRHYRFLCIEGGQIASPGGLRNCPASVRGSLYHAGGREVQVACEIAGHLSESLFTTLEVGRFQPPPA